MSEDLPNNRKPDKNFLKGKWDLNKPYILSPYSNGFDWMS